MSRTDDQLDEAWLRPADFDSSFADQPEGPGTAEILRRCRQRKRRRRQRMVLTITTALVIAVLAATTIRLWPSAPQYAVPSGPEPSATLATPTTAPSASASTSAPAADTAPKLRWDAKRGYLDNQGHPLGPGGSMQTSPFSDTTANTYRLVQQALDPKQDHLEPYQKDAFSGGGGTGVQIGQKLGWKNSGDPGEGVLQVTVSRAAPGKKAKAGPSADTGACQMIEGTCRQRTIDGHQVYHADLGGGAFVVELVQADGEVASMIKNPVFGNNTDIALSSMDVSVQDAVALLTDPRLDVIG